MASSLAPSLTSASLSDSALTKSASLFPLLRRASSALRPSISAFPHLSISFKPLSPLVVRTSSWAPQEVAETEGEFVSGDEEGEVSGLSEGEETGEVEEQGGEFAGGESAESYPDPPEEAKLFVGGIPFDVTSEKLAELFDQAGIVEVAEIVYNRGTDQSRGFGFVTMSTVEEAEKAVEMFNRYEFGGRILTVNKAAARGERVERGPREPRGPAYTMYVGNLPWSVDEPRLQEVFSEHGKVVRAKVMFDRETGRSRGFGFVTMETKEEMDDAIAALDGQTLDGRALRVNIAETKPRPSY
ncbi:hypothetical protein LUZ60_015677 [Juncus effusus]|nr:hypothetical protein LUZ60_015677 [Juncus effusus]